QQTSIQTRIIPSSELQSELFSQASAIKMGPRCTFMWAQSQIVSDLHKHIFSLVSLCTSH
uniref:Uncharacterized protein n=1 Tax=Anabas testudineus TaxID=64144 RepID=A0A3Q1IFC7_ANATE